MVKTTATTIGEYNKLQTKNVQEICNFLELTIHKALKKSESKIWHGSPVWLINGNPIVSYSVRKSGAVSLMFFSGQSFEEKELQPEGRFKAAEILYTTIEEIKITHLKRWLKKAHEIQWDYKNIVKRKGALEKIEVGKVVTKQNLNRLDAHNQRMKNIIFGTVYPMYLVKVEKKGRTKEELDEVIQWLTGFTKKKIQELIREKVTFETFFQEAALNPKAHLITGLICGYRIEDIKDPLTQKVRYLDKLVDELAKGRTMEKILRVK